MSYDLTFTVLCEGGTSPDDDTCVAANKTEFFTRFTDFGLTMYLYDEPAFVTYFDTHYNSDSSSTTQKQYAEEYSSYAIAWTCNLTNSIRGFSDDADKDGSGCCLRDTELDTEGGGYCLLYDNADPTVPKTYRITEDNFESLTSSTSVDVSADYLQSFGTDTAGFIAFNCDTVTSDELTNCRKLQFWPAASYANGFRFEKDKTAMAYFFDAQSTTLNERWVDEEQTLNHALSSIFIATSAVAVTGISMLL